uniref:F-box domain-containing protein n=1 Tax=Strongyloides venezuelensis TaxID=75913 RepID=A0A0K0G2B2_STRVS
MPPNYCEGHQIKMELSSPRSGTDEKELKKGDLRFRFNRRESRLIWLSHEAKVRETLGNDYELMMRIISMVTRVSERKNLRLASKLYESLCNEKESVKWQCDFIDRTTSRRHFIHTISLSNHENLINLHGSTLIINLPKVTPETTAYLKIHKTNIILNSCRIRTMEVRCLNGRYRSYLKSLDCFENVKTVTYSPEYPKDINLRFFKSCETLKPTNIRFLCCHGIPIEPPDVDYEEFDEYIPSSVEKIELLCRPDEIDWIFEVANFIPEKRFENLVLSSYFVENLPGLKNSGRKMLILTRCFKNVEVTINQKLSYNVIDFFMKYDWLIVFTSETNVEYFVDIVLSKNGPTEYDLQEHEKVPRNFNNLLELKRFKAFKVTCDDSWKKPPKFYTSPFPYLLNMMRNLVKLELSMNIFLTTADVENLIDTLSGTLEDVKFTDCRMLKESGIRLLATKCTRIKNLSLESLSSPNIPIQKITWYFKNLQSLSMYFLSHPKNIGSFASFVESDSKNSPRINKWPDMDFLHLAFESPKDKDLKTLRSIEKGTPRKGGIFIIKHHGTTDNHRHKIVEIIIQKSVTFYEKYIKIFSLPCWL